MSRDVVRVYFDDRLALCLHCRIYFLPRRANQRYCSDSCSAAERAKRARNHVA